MEFTNILCNSTVPSPTYSQDPHFDKALQGIENLQKLTSSELEDTASLGRDSELEDEGEDILVAGGLEGALEVHGYTCLGSFPGHTPTAFLWPGNRANICCTLYGIPEVHVGLV